MNLLDVYFHNKKIGVLKEHNSRLSFKYSDDATESIAYQLPLQKEAFGDKETRSFFSNLLPEGDVVKKIAQIKQISLNNPFALLRELGGECAGAVSLYPQDMTPIFNDTLEEISEDELAALLGKLSQTPLLTGEGVRLSLAGAQEKLALTIFPNDDKYYKPSDKYISTWILKPENRNFPGLIYNEYFCMKLAGLVGLNVAECRIKDFGSVTAYMTKRFDRLDTIERIQQEDFCQGLGLSNKKYQRTEGGPSVKQCFQFIHNNLANKAKDELHFLKSVVFNFLIGNSDAHGKNFSYLHTENGYVLTPKLSEILGFAPFSNKYSIILRLFLLTAIIKAVSPKSFGLLTSQPISINLSITTVFSKLVIFGLTTIIINGVYPSRCLYFIVVLSVIFSNFV